jgi:predicted Zn-dependent protease
VRSSVASFAGEAGRSYATLRAALEATGDVAAAERDAAAERAWILGVLADMATRLGDVAAARTHYEDALALAPRDSVLRTAYADLLLDQGEAAAALRLLGDETRNDGFLLRVALAERALGAPTLAAHVADLRARFAAARLRGDQRHLREESRFTLELLHDAGAALALAQRDWAVQREPEDARVLLAAAAAAGDGAAAEPVRGWIAAHRVEDVRLDTHGSGRGGGG